MAKYLLDIKIGNVTTDPMVIWGQFAQNVTDFNFSYDLPISFNQSIINNFPYDLPFNFS
jgi:hypothetical protein